MNSPKAQQIVLVLRLRDRFLIHIIVKHVAEQSMTVRRNHEKTLAWQERPCSVFRQPTGPGILRSAEMGRTSAGLHERDAGCGVLTRDRTTRRIKRKTLVHYLVSPPHRLRRVGDKPKLYIPGNKRNAAARFCKYRLLNPAGSGTRGHARALF
jgi:hypothetical protein